MTATPVANNANDVICSSSLVACDGTILTTAGAGTPPAAVTTQRTKPVIADAKRHKPQLER